MDNIIQIGVLQLAGGSFVIALVIVLGGIWLKYRLEKSIQHEYSRIEQTIQHEYDKRLEDYKRSFDRKVESYSNLIDFVRSFMNDPGIEDEEKIRLQREFISKFHNNILLYSSEEVIKSVDKFFGEIQAHEKSVNIKHVNKNTITDAVFDMIGEMRKDLGLEIGSIKNRHKLYTIQE